MAKNDASIIISAVDQFTSTFGKLKSELSFAEKGFAALGVSLSAAGMAAFIKSSMDAANELHDLAIQAQMSVDALSGLKEIGRTTNTGAADIASAADKMAKALNSGGTAARNAVSAIGLSYAKLKSERPEQAMLDIAKAMDRYQDGQSKAAVAMALFGKEGSKFIPFLKDLADAGEIHATMTQEQSDRADELADKMDRLTGKFDQWKVGVGLEVLPVMGDLIKAFGDIGTETDRIGANKSAQNFAEGLGRAIAMTVDVARNAGLVFQQLGKDMAAIFKTVETGAKITHYVTQYPGQLGLVINRDKIAQEIDSVSRFKSAYQDDLDHFLTGDDFGFKYTNAFDSAMEQRKRDPYGNGAALLDYMARGGKGTSNKIPLAFSTGESGGGAKVGALDADTLWLEGMQIAAKQLKEEQTDLAAAIRDTGKASKEAFDQMQEYMAAVGKETEDILLRAQAAEEENAAIGKTGQQLADLANARLTEQISAKESYAATLQGIAGREAELFAIQQQIDGLSRLKNAEAQRPLLQKSAAETKALSEMWKRVTDNVYQSLTDALFRGFENGKGFMKNLKDTLLNTFKTLVLRPSVEFIMSPVTGGLAGLFGAESAIAGTSGGNSSSGVGGVTSVLKSGFDLVTGTFTSGINSLAETLGSNFLLGNASTIGTALGVGSLALGAIALLGGLGSGHVMRPKGYANTSVSGSGVTGMGSWTNGEGDVSAQAVGAGSSLGKYIMDVAKLFGGSIKDAFTIGTKYMQKYNSLGVTVGHGITKTNADFTIDLNNKDSVTNGFARTFLDAVKMGYVKLDAYLNNYIGALKNGAVGNSGKQKNFLDQALELKTLYDGFATLPPIFGKVKTAIDGMFSQDTLARAQKMSEATKNFYNLFYTDQEKFSDLSKSMHKQLGALNVSFPETRDGFKQLVQGIDTSSAAGTSLYESLVNLATPMDEYFKAIEAQNSAASAAAGANQDLASAMTDAKSATDALLGSMTLKGKESFATRLDYSRYMAQAATAGIIAPQRTFEGGGNVSMANAVDRLATVVEAGNVAVAKNTAETAKILRKFDGDGMPSTRA